METYLEDIPSNMPFGTHGIYEPDGMSIWINQQEQADLTHNNTGVLCHEFTHYVHSVSTFQAVGDLISLLFCVHSGVQALSDSEHSIQLPLIDWTKEVSCTESIKNFVKSVRQRKSQICESFGVIRDSNPPQHLERGRVYRKENLHFIWMKTDVGILINRLSLLEGAAVAKKCEAVGDVTDMHLKTIEGLWHYTAIYEACRLANCNVDPLISTKYLSDVALCSPDSATVFIEGLSALREFGNSGSIAELEQRFDSLYKVYCYHAMDNQRALIQHCIAILPKQHTSKGPMSWAAVALTNSLNAVKRRQQSPLSLIKPIYLGASLHELAQEIGTPVILTNDMRLTNLASNSPEIVYATNCVRTISYLCYWIIEGANSPPVCPYSGCPGCPKERQTVHCGKDARKPISLPDELPWCALFYSAKQLRIVEILREDLKRRPLL